jgi:hypothetical protein
MALPLQITVGGGGLYDPVAGTSAVSIPFLAGFQFYIESTGVGTWKQANWSRKNEGGFNLLNGFQFAGNDTYSIHITGGFALSAKSGSYTNGYNLEKVLAALVGRLGWMQPEAAGSPVIDPTNLTSISGRYFNDGSFHSLVTVENIKACMEEIGATDVNLNSYLTTLQRSIALRCLNAVFEGPEIVEEVKLFERYGYNDQAISDTGSFVGYEINVANQKDAATQLDNVIGYFTKATPVRLYLFKDGVKDPIWTDQFTPDAGWTQKDFPVSDIVLNTGRYWFGYFQDDLIDDNQGIWEQASCWNRTLLFGASSVLIPANGNEIDRENRTYPGQTYGLNLELSSFRDHTSQIVRKANMFDELIGLQMASVICEMVIYATRINGKHTILKDQVEKVGLQYELNGAVPISETPRITGLRQRIEREAKKVKELFYPKPKAQSVSLC